MEYCRGIAHLFRYFILVLFVNACTVASGPQVAVPDRYPAANGPGEQFQPGEAVVATKIIRTIKTALRDRATERLTTGSDRPFIRDAHPKAHGCVKANFQVVDGLPADLAEGVFKAPRSFCSWVRFSNSNEDPDRDDAERDGRGMAIKLLNVPGKTLLEEHAMAGTQDFIMISHPVFFINGGDDYTDVIRQVNSESTLDKLLLPFKMGIQGTWNAIQITRLKNKNPFEARYWSMVPYQLGLGDKAKAIKFKAQPCGYDKLSTAKKEAYGNPDLPEGLGPNFLRKALKSAIQGGEPCMELLVQIRQPSMSVEDSKTEWRSDASWWDRFLGREIAPFHKVATLRFLKDQTFDTVSGDHACEDMAFNPWHALPEHKPLGAINRMRKVIYQEISEFRRKNNKVIGSEPPAYQRDQCVDDHWEG